ncbi:MAG: hypothetical protein C0497_02825 [Gemmatimonas sp.]|nr:hypothetical protein [Gemmatimonas sp.]
MRSAAATALESAAQVTPRTVDWTAAADDLQWLLGGTNTSAFAQVASVLVRTEVSPALAPRLLAGNGELLLAHARAVSEQAHGPAWSLLRGLSGRDARGDVSIWQAWLRDLQ